MITMKPAMQLQARLAVVAVLAATLPASAHPDQRPATLEARRQATAAPRAAEDEGTTAALRLRVDDASGRPAAALVRVTPLDGNREPSPLPGLFERPVGWYSMPGEAEVPVRAGRYRVEATRGTGSTVVTAEVECPPGHFPTVQLTPRVFCDTASRNLRAVNTHLHLLLDSRLKVGVDLRSRAEADAYLRIVGASDGLDLVYVSYLTQPGQEIVSNELTRADLAELSRGPVRFADGIEHRHAGKRITVEPKATAPGASGAVYSSDNSAPAMSYGHVLLLGLRTDAVAASSGPGLSEQHAATDGTALRPGMAAARAAGAAVAWSHGTQGLEWVPSLVAGVVDGQNIYDGGNEGGFEDVYYALLNAGFRVPFSTGTDWGVTDFSRVQVSGPEPVTPEIFRRELVAGRTYITNEPFLEFTVEGKGSGDTIALDRAVSVRVRGRAVGRSDFVRIQVVQDGRVVAEAPSRPAEGYFEASIDETVAIPGSGWLALRIPPVQPYFIRAQYTGPGTNLFGKAIFAHTSPVYVTVAGRAKVDPAAVELLIARVQTAWRRVDEVGVFADAAEKESIWRIYREAEDKLQERLPKASNTPGRHVPSAAIGPQLPTTDRVHSHSANSR